MSQYDKQNGNFIIQLASLEHVKFTYEDRQRQTLKWESEQERSEWEWVGFGCSVESDAGYSWI